ncbi:MAG: hypothetical protein GY760_02235 [Deltaproteobacteria bacterium]|nr:hypothetical protein [Deltaproteobacteria bacterium]
MNAETVYTIAKALPAEEQKELLEMLKKDFAKKSRNRKKQQLITNEEADRFLLENVFNVKFEQ